MTDMGNTEGTLPASNPLDGVDMGSQSARLGALSSIIGVRQAEEPAPGPQAADRASDTPETPPDAGDDGRQAEDETKNGEGIAAEPQGDEPEGEEANDTSEVGSAEETGQPRSFEELVETAGLSADEISDLTFNMVVDGEEQTFTFKELVRNNRRQADLTRGFQEVADARKQFADLQTQHANGYRDHIEATAAVLKTLDRQIRFDEAQIAKLRATNPEAASAAMARNQRNQQALQEGLREIQELKAQQDKAQAEAQASQDQYHYEMLVNRHPHLRDEKAFKTFGEEVSGYLSEMGYSADEVGDVSDHRFIEICMDAMKARKAAKMQKAIDRKTVRKTPQKTLKGRSSTSQGNSVKARAAAETARNIRAGKTGSLAGWLRESGMA